jgi:Uncharacterised nucleotidyltransferase
MTNRLRVAQSLGFSVAHALFGSWRTNVPDVSFRDMEIERVAPLLLATGAGAMAWRAKSVRLSESYEQRMRDRYLWYAVHAIQHEQEIVATFRAMRTAGIEPILVKGWAIARHYAEPGLRPSGDIDLCVHSDELEKASQLARHLGREGLWIDLKHVETEHLDFEDFFAASNLVDLNGTAIRIPSAEDHLRILCLHFLKHGASRPLWLCDVSAALESASIHFDWCRCLGPQKRVARWILCTMILAHRLLGALISGTPAESASHNLPAWLMPAVLKQWGRPRSPHAQDLMTFGDHFKSFSNVIGLIRAVRLRWPGPIQATISTAGEFNDLPRILVQLEDCFSRARKSMRQVF